MKLIRLVVLVATVAASVALFFVSAAAAHTGFESSEPGNEAIVDEPVDTITLRFSGPTEPVGEGFTILDANGIERTPDHTSADAERSVWTLAFDPPLTDGTVGVRWRVQAPDAHPIQGSFRFTTTATSAGPVDDTTSPTVVEGEAAPATAAPVPESVARGAVPEPQLDAFLNQGAGEAVYVDEVGALGRLVGYLGTTLGLGGLVFAAFVLRGHPADLSVVLQLAKVSAAALLVGAGIELFASLATTGGGWTALWSAAAMESVIGSSPGVAVGLRFIGGAVLYLAVGRSEHVVERRVPAQTKVPVTMGASSVGRGDEPHGPVGGQHDHDDGPAGRTGGQSSVRLPVTWPLVAGAAILLLSFTYDGHTATSGTRLVTGVIDIVHVGAGAVWGGGLLSLVAVMWRRLRNGDATGGLELALRFSVIAGVSLAVAGVAGSILAFTIVDGISTLWATPWGRLLVAKVLVVVVAGTIGTYNHFVILPRMASGAESDRRSLGLRETASLEALVLVVILGVTAFLVGAAST